MAHGNSKQLRGQKTMAQSSPVTIALDQPGADIKAASTAPVAADKAVVVAVSPNTPTLPVSLASVPLAAGASTSALQTTGNTSLNNIDIEMGALTETAPASDTASSGLNGRLQRIAQRITSLLAIVATSTKQSDGSQKTQIVDSSGNVIGSVASAGNNMLVAIGATNYVLSTANTSVAQLAAGNTFTGAIETTFNQQSYSILLTSDQNGTLTLRQYIDAAGTFVASTIVIPVLAGVPVAQSNVVNGNFFNLTFQNNGASATTTLNINTAYGTIPATTQLNNAPVAINEINGVAISSVNQEELKPAIPVRPAPQRNYKTNFSRVRSSFDTLYWTTIATGSGMTATQSGGNGLITTGTTINSETIVRSTEPFNGAFTSRVRTILSQRIANQNFFVELVDIIGDARAITISSATAVTVTLATGHGFTSENVGQSMYLGAYVGTGTFVPGRYTIASVSGNNITFTVAGFAAGSGTCSVFGWNYHQLTYTGVTATSVNYDAQNNGWASGVTAATINTTASPGHIAIINNENNIATFMDALSASTATIQTTTRASRSENIPGNERAMFLQIRAVNGAVAPASTTTMTLGFASVEDYVPQQMSIVSSRSSSVSSPQPVQVISSTTIPTTLGSTTITSEVPGTAATNLGKAEDAVHATGDTGVAMLALRNDTLTSNTSNTGDYILPITDIYGALVIKDQQRHKRTYRAAFVVAPAAAATDIFQLIGSASTTVEITKVLISGTQTTGGMTDVYISKRSTANTGGTSTASTNVPMISTDAAATAVGSIYTANPTTGTPVGDVFVESIPLSTVTATTLNVLDIRFGEFGKPVQLVGVAQALAIRLNGATLTGGSIKIVVEFTEF